MPHTNARTQAYANGEAVNAHLKNVGPLIGKILESACTLDSIEIHGPSVKREVASFLKEEGTSYYIEAGLGVTGKAVRTTVGYIFNNS